VEAAVEADVEAAAAVEAGPTVVAAGPWDLERGDSLWDDGRGDGGRDGATTPASRTIVG